MITVTQTELRNNIRKYIDAAAQGEEIEVCRHGKPVVTLVAQDRARVPHWKRPREPMVVRGMSLAKMIIEDRR